MYRNLVTIIECWEIFAQKNRESATKKFKKFATLQNLALKEKADTMVFFM
jgi:hypothetical protein